MLGTFARAELSHGHEVARVLGLEAASQEVGRASVELVRVEVVGRVLPIDGEFHKAGAIERAEDAPIGQRGARPGRARTVRPVVRIASG